MDVFVCIYNFICTLLFDGYMYTCIRVCLKLTLDKAHIFIRVASVVDHLSRKLMKILYRSLRVYV